MRNSLALQIARMLQQAGPLSTREIQKRFMAPRRALQSAYADALERGWVCVRRKATKGRKAIPAILEAGEITERQKEKPVPVLRFRVSCVWDLAGGISVKVPKMPGQIFKPLGEWEDTPEQRPGA